MIQSDTNTGVKHRNIIGLSLAEDGIKVDYTRKHHSHSRRGEAGKKNQLNGQADITLLFYACDLQTVTAQCAFFRLIGGSVDRACDAGHGLAGGISGCKQESVQDEDISTELRVVHLLLHSHHYCGPIQKLHLRICWRSVSVRSHRGAGPLHYLGMLITSKAGRVQMYAHEYSYVHI